MENQILSTREAAAFLGIAEVTLKRHLYVVGDLEPSGRLGRQLYFTAADLLKAKKSWRPGGRPNAEQPPETL